MTGEQGLVFLSGWHRPVYREDPATPWMGREAQIALKE